MRVKKYRAPDRATALKQIKAELGSEAVILQEQPVRHGPLGLFGKPEVEILAAIEDDPLVAAVASRQERARSDRMDGRASAHPARNAEAPAAEPGGVQATISSAGRRASSATQPTAHAGARGRGGAEGVVPASNAERLAAILAELPETGESLSPELAAQLADLVAQAADGKLDELIQASAADGGADTAKLATAGMAPQSTSPAPTVDRPARGGAVSAQPPARIPSRAGDPSGRGLAGDPSGGRVPGVVRPSDWEAPPKSNGRAAATDGAANVLGDVQRTLADLRSAIDHLARQTRPAPATRESPALRTIYQRLMEQEVEPGIALELTGQIADDLGPDHQADLAAVESKLLALLRPMLPTRSLTTDHRPPTPDQQPLATAPRPLATKTGPRVVVIVGPTGVGKTTTVAKLAAHLSLLPVAQTGGATGNPGRQRVCLVTTDTFRIAAAAQLGTYADIMRLPLEVVYAANEVPEAIGKHADADYVIVDTPGCGQHNEPQLQELAGFVQAATGAAPDATVLMAVAAPTKLSDMLAVQERFGTLNRIRSSTFDVQSEGDDAGHPGFGAGVDGLVLTKLDETHAFGPLLSLIRRAGKPVYYVTTGQNVPNDIEEASSDALARLVAGSLTPPTDRVGTQHAAPGGGTA